jgi:hypothetical protein
MIAIRLRVTGHTEAEIEAILLADTPTVRSGSNHRDWQDYARRTAAFAFSRTGDAKAASCARHRRRWRQLEEGGKPKIAVDDRFGRLRVAAVNGSRITVACDCGQQRTVRAYDLLRDDGKNLISCGCWKKELVQAWIRRHARKVPPKVAADVWSLAQADGMTVVKVAKQFGLDRMVARHIINQYQAQIHDTFTPARVADAATLAFWVRRVEGMVADIDQRPVHWSDNRGDRYYRGEMSPTELQSWEVWQATQLVQLLGSLTTVPARYLKALEAAKKLVALVKFARAARAARKKQYARKVFQKRIAEEVEEMVAIWNTAHPDYDQPPAWQDALPSTAMDPPQLSG